MNNKLLIGLFVGLLAAWGISKLFSTGESTFNPDIIIVDSASVDKIVLHAKADNFVESTIEKTPDGWRVKRAGKTYIAFDESISRLLGELKTVTTSQIVAKNPEKWAQYEVADDQATRFAAYSNGKLLADFYVGKLNINQQAQKITSYFRLADGPDVYAVEGTDGMTLGQSSNAYRIKQVMQMKEPKINEVNLEGDVGYHIKRRAEDRQWILDGAGIIDSNQVQNYLINLRSMSGEAFIDDFEPSQSEDKLLKTLTIRGDNLPGDIIVRCWKDESRERPFIINSNLFPESYFASDSTRLFTRLFKPIQEW